MRTLEIEKEEGFAEGKQEGIEIGIKRCNINVVKNMLADNFELEMISKITGLSLEQIKSLRQ